MYKLTNRNRAIAFGVGFLVFYILLDFFWQHIWLWSVFLLLVLALGFVVFIIKCLLKKEWVVLLYVLVVSIGIAGKEIASSETFKSPII